MRMKLVIQRPGEIDATRDTGGKDAQSTLSGTQGLGVKGGRAGQNGGANPLGVGEDPEYGHDAEKDWATGCQVHFQFEDGNVLRGAGEQQDGSGKTRRALTCRSGKVTRLRKRLAGGLQTGRSERGQPKTKGRSQSRCRKQRR